MILTRNNENSSSMTKISLTMNGHNVRAGVKMSPACPDVRASSSTTEKVYTDNDVKPSTSTGDSPSTPTKAEGTCSKPFFIMDWLDEVKPADLELAQRMLKTPHTSRIVKKQSDKATSPFSLASFILKAASSPSKAEKSADDQDLQPVARDLFAAGPSPAKAPTAANSSSYYLKRSIAVGNGWNAKGLAKAKRGLWRDALACWENALTVRTQVLGPSHIDVANTCNNMGIAVGKLQQGSKPSKQAGEQAMALLKQALDIREAHYGRNHPEVAATLHNIGNVLQQSGEWEQAVDYFMQAKDLQQELVGEDHAQVARAWRAMGHAYFEGNRLVEAHRSYCEGLRIFERLQAGFLDGENKKTDEDDDDYSIEIDAARVDIQELNQLMHHQACKRTGIM